MLNKRNYLRLDVIIGLTCFIIGCISPFTAIPIKFQQVFGIVIFALIFWVCETISIERTSILVIIGFLYTDLINFDDIILTIRSDTPWLIVTGMAISVAISELEIGKKLVSRGAKLLSETLIGLVIQMHLVGLLTAIIVPSGIVRVIILFPLGKAIAKQFSEDQQPELQKIILLSLTVSTVLGGFGILTGSVPNMIASGIFTMETNTLSNWSNWLILMFPAVSILRILISIIIVWNLYSHKFSHLRKNENIERETFDRRQTGFLIIMTFFLVALLTDSIHKFSPLEICIVCCLIIFSKPIGPLSLTSLKYLKFSFIFYIFALLFFGIVIEASGLTSFYKSFIISVVDSRNLSPLNLYVISALSTIPLSLFMDVAVVAAVLMPIYLDVALRVGLDTYVMMMSVCLGCSVVFLPYQAAPLMLAYTSGYLPKHYFLKVLGIVALLSVTLLYPINIGFWVLLGFL